MKCFRLGLIAAALFAFSALAHAQNKELKKTGITPEEVVPEGWELKASAMNDINHDYIPDMVIVAVPDYPENIVTRDDGFKNNMNMPIVAVYFGNCGVYELWYQAAGIIEAQSEFGFLDDVSLSISAKGVINIGYKMFYSAGSWSVPTHKFAYRYQDESLYLIGYDCNSFNRATHNEEIVSYNFLTGKKQTRTLNNSGKVLKDKWEKIKKKPLLEFGSNPLDYIF